MKYRKPDFLWILAVIVGLGVASTGLIGDEDPEMAPQQAGIILQ